MNMFAYNNRYHVTFSDFIHPIRFLRMARDWSRLFAYTELSERQVSRFIEMNCPQLPGQSLTDWGNSAIKRIRSELMGEQNELNSD